MLVVQTSEKVSACHQRHEAVHGSDFDITHSHNDLNALDIIENVYRMSVGDELRVLRPRSAPSSRLGHIGRNFRQPIGDTCSKVGSKKAIAYDVEYSELNVGSRSQL